MRDGADMLAIEETRPAADDEEARRVDVTVVIPAYNEERGLAESLEVVHEVLESTGRSFEIIVVDDGSADRTAEIAAELPCRLIRQPRNMGYGAALKRGFREARSEIVIITDADGTYPAEEIPALFEQAETHDMVVGSRTGRNVHIPLVRRPAKWALRKLASYLAGYPIPDLNSGLRLIRRADVARFSHILPNGFSFTTTITLALLCNGMGVAYVPIDYKKRLGKSKIRPVDAWHFLVLSLRVAVLFNPLKVFLPVGALVAVGGMLKLTYDLTVGNLSETAVTCFLTTVIIWAVGLLADQNSRLGIDREPWGE